MSLNFQFISKLSDVPEQQWQALVCTDYPFIQYSFLNLLETTGAVGEGTGWQPHHLVAYEGEQLVAALPLYIKYDWTGEYVFDWSWDDAYRRYGMRYYPKLTASIPFTPVTGPRILCAADKLTTYLPQITNAIMKQCEVAGFSSIHLLFSEQAISEQLTAINWQQRRNVQFQWYNQSFQHFDEFLATFSSRKRKNVKKERKKFTHSDFYIKKLHSAELTEEHMQFFYHCYRDTYLKRSGHEGYLPAAFFAQLLTHCRDQLLLVLACKQYSPVAGALYFFDSNALYGRYWGGLADIDGLHFECCYYQGIEFCIERGLAVFNPGTQGEHKIQRGFEPTYCYSNHWLKEPAFHQAITHFLEEEDQHISLYKAQAKTLLPFKKDSE